MHLTDSQILAKVKAQLEYARPSVCMLRAIVGVPDPEVLRLRSRVAELEALWYRHLEEVNGDVLENDVSTKVENVDTIPEPVDGVDASEDELRVLPVMGQLQFDVFDKNEDDTITCIFCGLARCDWYTLIRGGGRVSAQGVHQRCCSISQFMSLEVHMKGPHNCNLDDR